MMLKRVLVNALTQTVSLMGQYPLAGPAGVPGLYPYAGGTPVWREGALRSHAPPAQGDGPSAERATGKSETPPLRTDQPTHDAERSRSSQPS